MSSLNDPTEEGYAGMAGMTAYNHVEGDFFLSKMPAFDSQVVKQTIQGVVDEFVLKTDEISLQSIFTENQPVNITETVYSHETTNVINKSLTSYATDALGNPFNRIVIQAGSGEYNASLATNVSSSVHDEIVALAVEDVRPFMIKGLDIDHDANIVNGKPKNDGYIRHLTPSDKPLIASIKSPSILTTNGGPSRILVYYDAIDLTGEVVAGTGLPKSDFNTIMDDYYCSTKKAYLVVQKTVPAASTVFSIGGTPRTLSDILLKPYASPPGTSSDVQLEITSAGGLISIPASNFKRPMKSHALKSYGQGGRMESPYIDVSDCLISMKNSILGYGRPRAIDNPNIPDQTSNPSHHVMVITPSTGSDLKQHSSTKQTPAGLSRASLQVFNVIDNTLSSNENLVLALPANRNRYAVLDDFTTSANSVNPSLITIEIALLSGRAEQFNVQVKGDEAELEIRGRSKLMDFSNELVNRDLNLGEAIPIKEIGDLGTPTATLSLGGLGQGGIDAKPIWDEHSNLTGWKDRIVGTGNPSVRNDKQTSTHYASTRALTEIPLFPSMFYDVEKIHGDGKELPHPSGMDFTMTVDATMTAMNRPQMQHIEGKNAIDWGMRDVVSAIRVNGQDISLMTSYVNSYAMRCQNSIIQGVITGHDLTLGTTNSYIQLDDVEAFENEAGLIFGGSGVLTNPCFITIGEGIITEASGQEHVSYYMMRIHKIDTTTNRIYPNLAYVRHFGGDHPVRTFDTTASTRADAHIFVGAVVMMGGIIANSNLHPNAPNYDASGPTTEGIRDAVRACLGLEFDVMHYPNTHDTPLAKELVLIFNDRVSMSGLEFDIYNEFGGKNDVYTRLPIECIPYFAGLKGIDSEGENLRHVMPQQIRFHEIALKSQGFKECVNEVIRKINMSGHPQAKNERGKSAYDTHIVSTFATGSHLGYVRAFLGKEVESKDGEKGFSIVIHSTVPGAAGRNFAVWFENRSSYPYRPIQAFGFGGLLAQNSRTYGANSFAAPMPIGSDGETYVPITTFTGAPHGRTIQWGSALYSNVDDVRSYDGIGQRYIAQTTNLGATGNAYGSYSTDVISKINVDIGVIDYMARSNILASQTSSSKPIIIRMNGKLATVDSVGPIISEMTIVSLENVRPYEDAKKFYDALFDNAGAEIIGLEVEFLNPLMDKDGIIFFGGGHTGVVFDISDGTDRDYSSDYDHHLALGPTGFSGFQNLGDFQGASAVLDFTDLRNEDTINDNTFRGFHHRDELDANGSPNGICRMYVRCVDHAVPGEAFGAGAFTQDNTEWREDLYNRKVRLTTTGFSATTASITDNIEITGSSLSLGAKSWWHEDVVALFNNNGGTIEAEHGEVKAFDPRRTVNLTYGISAVIKPGVDLTHFTGPILQGIYNDGVSSKGYPWGLHVAGQPPVGVEQEMTIALSYPTGIGIGLPIGTSLLVPSSMPSNGIKVNTNGWTFIMAGHNSVGESYCYIGNTVGINDPLDPGAPLTPGLRDLTEFMANVADQNYGITAIGPNKRNTFDTQSNGYGGGVRDHPDVPAALQTIRDKDMATIGCALIGAPYVHFTGGEQTQGNHPCAPFTGYFSGMLSGASTYGTVDATGTTGTNSAGPIHFAGFLSEVALWKRDITFIEASTLWAGRSIW
jgi:hypothetical protein